MLGVTGGSVDRVTFSHSGFGLRSCGGGVFRNYRVRLNYSAFLCFSNEEETSDFITSLIPISFPELFFF